MVWKEDMVEEGKQHGWMFALSRRRGLRQITRLLAFHRCQFIVFICFLMVVYMYLPSRIGEDRGGELLRQRRVITTNLDRITDPVNELVAEKAMTQLHHGLYRIVSPLKDGSGDAIQFVFKAECRPASKWHGQQGWTEVAVHHFQRLFYEGDNEGTYPKAEPARGVVIAITKEQLLHVVHRDRCGVLTEKDMVHLVKNITLRKKFQRWNQIGVTGKGKNATVFMIGVALTWRDGFDDRTYPSAFVYAPYFVVPPSYEQIKRIPMHRGVLYEMSDVMVFDYLLLNPDRAFGKNWFRDKATHLHSALMDNGWAFAGEKFKSSVCEVESRLLYCPSPLRTWSSQRRSQWQCIPWDLAKVGVGAAVVMQKSRPALLKWCRFRPETRHALNRTRIQWHNENHANRSLSQRWIEEMKSDALMAFLLEAYGAETSRKWFNLALARYVHGCPLYSIVQETSGHKLSSLKLLHALEVGLLARMDRLAAHLEECLQEYGETYVYALDVEN
ncbi:glycogenin glucosyltransferase, putative [Trypanosoma cruzi marinkellei]|uniref:Glycogenin glucosyltransferase, putative n=1 Tax=Trypanosoma cruzi marinkellei TaxID=85056 RepID=K2NQH8_TRYCR|nr:glycogenin glucosyltransferase, putative [Trypanosoma cruzi marinkellei]